MSVDNHWHSMGVGISEASVGGEESVRWLCWACCCCWGGEVLGF